MEKTVRFTSNAWKFYCVDTFGICEENAKGTACGN